MATKNVILKEIIEQLVNYLEPFLPLANVHMVDYFTKNVYKNYIPQKIQKEIEAVGYKNVIEMIFNDDYRDLPHLNSYALKSKQFTIKNLEICLNSESFQEKLSSLGCSDIIRIKLNSFMTSKKSHEVDILSYVAAAVNNISGTSHLVDIGDGKGYLSSMLALHHKIPVLGVDSSEINTNGAVLRVKKLSRVWNNEVSKIINKGEVLQMEDLNKKENSQTSQDMYKQITKYVDEKVDFVELVSNVFLKKPNELGLVGLHTCGNLTTTCLRIFSTNKNIKTICNVGCCYHLIKEAFDNDKFYLSLVKTEDTCGFPMSNFLKEKKFKLGRAARMIAAQSMERILNKKEMPNEILFFRSLFEVLLEKEFNSLHPEKKHVGRFRKKPENFVDYTRKALKRLKLNKNISDSDIQNIINEYGEREFELYAFFLIRNMLAPIIEALILLDRLLYLQELGFEQSYLVQLFDPVVSPRCYGLIAIK